MQLQGRKQERQETNTAQQTPPAAESYAPRVIVLLHSLTSLGEATQSTDPKTLSREERVSRKRMKALVVVG